MQILRTGNENSWMRVGGARAPDILLWVAGGGASGTTPPPAPARLAVPADVSWRERRIRGSGSLTCVVDALGLGPSSAAVNSSKLQRQRMTDAYASLALLVP